MSYYDQVLRTDGDSPEKDITLGYMLEKRTKD